MFDPNFLNFLSFLIALACPVALGLVTLSIIVGNQRWPISFTIALSYCLGMGVITQLILLLGGCFNLRLDLFSLLSVSFFYVLFFIPISLWRQKQSPCAPLNLLNPKEISWGRPQQILFFLLLAFIVYQMSYVFWSSFFIPIYQADAFTEHAYKAKVFFYDQNLNQATYLWRLGYPLQIPLTMDWVALNIGQWNEHWIKLIFACNGLAFVIIVYAFMRYWTSRLIAMASIALMFSSILFTLHASIAYGDFTIMLYTISALLLLCWGISLHRIEILVLAGIMSAFAASVKLEGINYTVLLCIVLVRFLLNKEFLKKWFVGKALLGFVLPLLGTFFISKIFQHSHHTLGTKAYSLFQPCNTLQELFPRSLMMAKEWISNLYLSGNWGITWFFLTGLWLMEFPKQKSFPFRFLSFGLVLFFAHYAFGSLFAGRFYFLGGSMSADESSRIFLHFFPLCPLLTGLLINDFLRHQKE